MKRAAAGVIAGTLRSGNGVRAARRRSCCRRPAPCTAMRRRPLRGCPVPAERRAVPSDSMRSRIARASAGPRSPNVCDLPAMHVLGHAAGERDDVGRALRWRADRAEVTLRSLRQRRRRRRLEQPVAPFARPSAPRRPTGGTLPTRRSTPASSANRRAASSMRITRPRASNATMRAPMSIAVSLDDAGRARTPRASMSRRRCRGSTRVTIRGSSARLRPSRALRALPRARHRRSTATKRPACAAKSSPIARAFARRTATPVRISAPVSIASGSTPASAYCRAMNAPSARGVDRRVLGIRRQQYLGLEEDLAGCNDITVVETLERSAARTRDATSTSRCRRPRSQGGSRLRPPGCGARWRRRCGRRRARWS